MAESLIGSAAGPLEEAANGILSLIAVSGRRLARRVNDILDLPKLKHHAIKVQKARVTLLVVVSCLQYASDTGT